MKQHAIFAVAFLALVLSSQAGRTGNDGNPEEWKPPKWYHGHDGPIFDILKTSDNAELRRYHPTVWVVTNITNSKFDDAFRDGGKRLDRYWGGDQSSGKKVAETVPQFVLIKPSDKMSTFDSTFSVEYFLPHELHHDPPTPKDSDVSLVQVPIIDVWVRTFGGYASEDDVVKNVFDFLKELQDAGVPADTSYVGFASYDAAVHVVNRHNEIWVWSKDKPTPSLADIAAARQQVLKKAGQAAWDLKGRLGSILP